jgi:hypothetical protein
MRIEKYRNLVNGRGVGGKLVAWNFAKRGEKTSVTAAADRTIAQ